MKSALVLACDDSFIPYTSVVARRIAHYATEIFPIIVVSDGVSDENKRLAQKFCPEISFIEASGFLDGRSLPVDDKITRAAHLRLFLPEILADRDHAVYLDSDVSPLRDVSYLLTLVPRAAPIIAAHDLRLMADMTYRDRLQIRSPYCNSGILVLDLNAIREEHIFERALQYAAENPERCVMHDQDALNAVLDGRWQVLDWRWNAMSYLSESMPSEPYIRHFAGCKPWQPRKTGVQRRFVDQWRSDLAASPWPDSFREELSRYRVRRLLRPASMAVERTLKTQLYSNSAGGRGNRTRLADRFAATLSAIENSAAADEIARWPDVFLTSPE